MSMFPSGSLSQLRDLVLPAAYGASGKAIAEGIPIVDMDVHIDFARDELQLCVRHTLLSSCDRVSGDWKHDIGPRLQSAMRLFHRMPASKALSVDRRLLQGRAAAARKTAPRPVRKPAKRRAA